MEHIRELRNRVLKMVLIVAVGSVVGWFFSQHVLNFVEAPYCALKQAHYVPGTTITRIDGHRVGCSLYLTSVFGGFFLRIKLAIASGVIVTSPLWLYQLWAFVAPGLFARERRWAYFFGGSAVPLFLIGGGAAYFAMTKGLHFLLGEVPHGVSTIITIDTYISYALAMLAIFGLAFELPLVFVVLNLARVITHERFRKWRRMIIFLVFAFAAIFTPSPDPISMLLLAVPCVLLVELAEVFIYFHDRQLARRGAYPGLSAEAQAMLADDHGYDGEDTTAGRSGGA